MAVDQRLQTICPSSHCALPFLRFTRMHHLSLLRLRMSSQCSSNSFLSTSDHDYLLRPGPVAQYHENSKYSSPVKPAVTRKSMHTDLTSPSSFPCTKRVSYRRSPHQLCRLRGQADLRTTGGTSSIFVHDDELQLIPESDREERVRFYADHGIGGLRGRNTTILREGSGFNRRGRFKKIIRLLEIERGEKASLADSTLPLMTMVALRMGEVILIVDSDTIVPEDSAREPLRNRLLPRWPELAECPESSSMILVNMSLITISIPHFTRRIKSVPSWHAQNGEVTPFVGHNAFLRRSVLQDAALNDPGDNDKRKIWSETNVSEDFDMALFCLGWERHRPFSLPCSISLREGYIIRWATYSEGDFKEGVSLTCDDELNLWQKYSYGCNELIFNPLVQWWRLGPVNSSCVSSFGRT
ncbi:glycosyl transferase family group 2-domain-containing protein, partial [Russula aff. rugulosa BPL654]